MKNKNLAWVAVLSGNKERLNKPTYARYKCAIKTLVNPKPASLLGA